MCKQTEFKTKSIVAIAEAKASGDAMLAAAHAAYT